ncbi:MAG: hypothetical protein JOZ77_00400 [Candidatus Eremiobacteraeota bacterium]|nr:hypothetical protein [Candidatus Eremiobacteraeota bacterium]
MNAQILRLVLEFVPVIVFSALMLARGLLARRAGQARIVRQCFTMWILAAAANGIVWTFLIPPNR